jgi:putative membrane protein
MLRYIKYACLVVIAVALVAIAMANRQFVTLKLVPDGVVSDVLPFDTAWLTIELPLFIAVFLGVILGFAIGYILEWLREHRQRAQAAKTAREMRRLNREVESLKAQKHAGKDEVLMLLDEAG